MNEAVHRIEVFDIWKGIIIFLVVLGHAAGGIIHSVPFSMQDGNNGVVILFHLIYSFHMPAFFLIAGMFCNSWINKPFHQASADKIRRLVIPYFIWGFILAAAMQIAGGYTNGGLGLKDYLWSPIVPFSEYWFLYSLFFIHLMYYAVSRLTSTMKKGKCIFLAAAAVLYAAKPWIPAIWIIDSFCHYTIYFAIGAVVSNVIRSFACQQVHVSYKWGSATLALIGANAIFLYFTMADSANNMMIWFAGFFIASANTTASLILSVYLEDKLLAVKNILSFWGRYSMEIYCTHLLVLSSIRILVLKIIGGQVWYGGFMWGITLLTMGVLSIVFLKIPKKYKIYKIAFGLKE